jgi:UDP:flavonoid glycosyltransferase YjiC (YdhE family)
VCAASSGLMRILLTSNRGAGHIGPLVPFAHAFARAGDDVVIAAPEGARTLVEREGLELWALADPPEREIEAVQAPFPSLTHEEQGVRMLRDVFAGIDARASLPRMLRAVGRLAPDVVLSEPTEFAGLLAAQRYGVPYGRIGIMSMAVGEAYRPVVAPVLDEHRERLRLPRDPRALRIASSPYLTVFPAALEEPGTGAGALRFREPPAPRIPLPAGDERPLVYVTYGSVLPQMPIFGGIFRATVDALGELPVRALFTVGNDVDVAALGAVPGNVRVERWIPQAAVMGHAAAMVGHGGSGTTRIALAAGVPSVVFPAFADQPRNARRVAELGAGIALPEGPSGLERLGDAILRVLAEPSYRAAAGRVAAEVSALPAIDEAPAALRAWLRADLAA